MQYMYVGDEMIYEYTVDCVDHWDTQDEPNFGNSYL